VTLAGDAVHHRSSMQRSSATSSAEAEYVAAGTAAKDIKWLRTLAREWKITLDSNPTSLHSINLHIDNSGAIAKSTADGPTRRSKHTDIQHHFINEQVQKTDTTSQSLHRGSESGHVYKSTQRVKFEANVDQIKCPARFSTKVRSFLHLD
jgi:hypothetical protein